MIMRSGRKGHFKLWCVMVLVCLVAGWALGIQPAKAWFGNEEKKVAELTIHAYAQELDENTHAYLTIKNITNETLDFHSYPIYPGKTMCISLFSDLNCIIGLGGVYINLDFNYGTSADVASYTIEITQKQFDQIVKKSPAESYYHNGWDDGTGDGDVIDVLWHNCTSYTIKMWNMVAPPNRQINLDNTPLPDIPMLVRDVIKLWDGSVYGPKQFPDDWVAEDNVYYLTKKAELIPFAVPKLDLSARVINNGDVVLEWNSVEHRLLNNVKNINSYQIEIDQKINDEWHFYSSHETDGLNTKATISGLPDNHEYRITVRGVKQSSVGTFPDRKTPRRNEEGELEGKPVEFYTGEDSFEVRIGPKLYIDDTDMESCLLSTFERNWAGATGDLAYAYWCQDRIYGVNGTDPHKYGHALINTLFVGNDKPHDFMVIVPGVHIRTRGVNGTPPRSYIVTDYDEISVGVTYVDADSLIRQTYYPWRSFYQFLNQQGGTAYVEYWNATGVSDPKGTASVSADAGRLHVTGWAVDASQPSQAIDIRVHVGNKVAQFVTDLQRDDLPYDGTHGFDKYVLTDLSGNQPVKVVAVNVGPGDDTVLYEGYVNIPSTQKLADPIMHIDFPSGSYVANNNIEVSFWVASNKRVTSAYYQAGSVQGQVGIAEDQAVRSAQPDYAYGYRCRGVIEVSRLSPDTSYPITVWVHYEDGTSSQTSGRFSVLPAPVVKAPLLHIDHPTGTYSGFQDMEFSGWIACDEPISYCFYEVASTDGAVAFQGGLNMSDAPDVQNSYPSYRYTRRMRGVISLGSLRPYKDYTCKLAVTLTNGQTYTTTHPFSVGAIYEYDTSHIVHVDSPAQRATYSGANNIEVSSWVVANVPITYCIYEIRRVSDGVYLGQWSLEAEASAPDLDAAYPNYAYRRRFRGVIEIAGLDSYTDYEFRIWYGIGDKGIQSSLGTARFSTGNISFEKYAVSYDLNGGNGFIDGQIKNEHQNLTLTSAVPSRTGYQFMGWATSPSATLVDYLPGDVYQQDSDLKLYAVWKSAYLLPTDLKAQDFTVHIPCGGSQAWFAFIPHEEGWYSFASCGTQDKMNLTLLDEDGAQLLTAYGSPGFEQKVKLAAGEKIYLRIGFTSGAAKGSSQLTARRCYRIHYALGGAESLLLHVYHKEHGKPFVIDSVPPEAQRTITFQPNGGAVAQETLTLNDRFNSWNSKADGTGTTWRPSETYTANEALTLYPVWNGAVVTELPVPTREGYTFEGWYVSTPSGQQRIAAGDVIRENVTLVAHWKANFLTISFDPNGGTGNIASITIKTGDSFTVPASQPERFGYEFLGWTSHPGSRWTEYIAGKSYTPASSMTLYAHWDEPTPVPADAKKEIYTMDVRSANEVEYYAFTPDTDTRFKFRVAGEPSEKDIAVFTAEGEEMDCAAETADGSRLYREYFLYANEEYIIRVSLNGAPGEVASLMIFRGYTVTQHYYGLNLSVSYCYEEQTDFRLLPALSRDVTLTFDPRGGSMEKTSQTYRIQQVAWSTEKDGGGVLYSPGSTRILTEPVDLYAVYDRDPCGEMETPVYEGYRFDGWYTNAYGTALGGTRISASGLANYLLSSSQGLFARWTKINEAEISFSSNGGTGTVSGIKVPLGDSFTVPEEVPERFGYRFLGWSTDPNAKQPSLYPGEACTADGALSLYAVWKAPTLIPSDGTYEISTIDLGASSQLDTYFIFTPQEGGRYQFRAAGEPDEKLLAVYDAHENPVSILSSTVDGSRIYQQYELEKDTSYIIQLSCTGEYGDLASLIMSRGYPVQFVSGTGSTETEVYFEQQEGLILPSCPALSASVAFDPRGGTVAQPERVYQLAHISWNTSPDGSGTGYSPGSSLTFSAPAVLYALYEDCALGQLEVPVRDGWRFDGWLTADGGEPVGEDVLLSAIGGDGAVLLAGWTELSSLHLKGLEAPAAGTVLPMERDTAVTGWAVAQEKITGAVFSLADSNGKVVWQAAGEQDDAAEDLKELHSSYAFHARMRSAIPASVLEPASSYTLSMWLTLGDTNAKTLALSCTLHTDKAAELSSDAATQTLSIPFSDAGSSCRYTFVPSASGRYLFVLSGAAQDMEIALYADGSELSSVTNTAEAGSVQRVYALHKSVAYSVVIRAKAQGEQLLQLGVHRGWQISYLSPVGAAEATYCYAGQSGSTLAQSPTETITLTLMPTGGSVQNDTLTYVRRIAEWNTQADGSGTGYAPGSRQSFAQDVTLYGIPESLTVGPVETPVRSGYQFNGWSTSEQDGTPVTEETPLAQLLDGERKLYALWVDLSRTITIRFDTSYGSGYPDPVTLPYGAGFVIPAEIPTMDECRFDGWYTEEYGEGTLVTDGMVFTEDTLLYPKWILVSWRASPDLQPPTVNGRTVTLRWNVYEQAQQYEIWEIKDNYMRRAAVVSGLTAELSRTEPGSHTYLVIPRHQGRNGNESNLVTAEVEHAVMKLPKQVTAIRESAFENNLQFTVVILGEQVKVIGDYAFRGCSDLQSIFLPSSIEAIGEDAFDGCSKLVVTCHAGSAAEEYCIAHSLKYILADE